MSRSPPPHELEAPSPSPLYAQRRGSTSDYLRVPAPGSNTPYNEKGHSSSPMSRRGWMNSSRARMAIVAIVVLGLCAYIWTHPSQFAANSNAAGAEQQFSAAGEADGNTRAQTMRSLSLAAVDAGRPVPLGVEFQCPAPQPCPIPLCPKADASGRMEPITADCPPPPQCPATECPDCPAQIECPAPVECPAPQEAKCDADSCSSICSASAAGASSALASLPSYMSSRLEVLAASSRNLVPGKNDLALQGSEVDLSGHEATWHYCEEGLKLKAHASRDAKGLALCPENARNEWFWQLSWFERTDARNKTGAKIGRHSEIQTPICAQLPPRGYTYPAKYPALPMDPSPGQPMSKTPSGKVDANELSHGAFPWQNLRMQKITDMLDFNSATPKNLYHFDGPNYDRQQHHFLKEVASIIPFEQKVRLMLDVGAGGASLGLLVKRLYDVQTVSTVFADWPYCEYITERGGLCMLLDSMTAFPFAKFSYDAVHSSWIFHGMYPKDLFKVFHEQNRVLRPGGYMWWVGGWSREQMAAIQSYAKALGYKELYSDVKKVANANKPGAWRFGTLQDIPYEVDWTVVWVKPIKAEPIQCSSRA